jgi:acyl carrier protein
MAMALENNTLSRETVENRLLAFLRENFPKIRNTCISFDDPLLNSGLVDSLGILSIVAFIDEELGLTVNDDEVNDDNFDTVNAIVRFVLDKADK